MVWYVAIVAILNLGLGYVLAQYLGAGRGRCTGDPIGSADAELAGD